MMDFSVPHSNTVDMYMEMTPTPKNFNVKLVLKVKTMPKVVEE